MPLAVVTGGSSGLGAAFVEALAARGWPILIIDREDPASRYASIVADLSNRRQLLEVCDELEDVGFLVNCAGFCEFEPFACSKRSLELIDLHATATVALTRAVLPKMLAARKGSIINVSSMTVTDRQPGTVAYSAAKVFQVGFSQYLAAELQGTGVTVQALCAPVMATKLWKDAGKVAPLELARDPVSVVAASLNALESVTLCVS